MNELATLGGGCFWCLDAFYRQVIGIESVVSGFAGGDVENPSYEQVAYEDTGHAEVVQLTFDPSVVTYREILEIFFTMHDPTTLNRQGNDVGEEYRSVVFYHDDKQKEIAVDMKDNFAAKLWDKPAVTQIEPFTAFYSAEDYHQNFYENNPGAGYCMVVINPKVQKLRQKFASKLKFNQPAA